MPDTPGEAAAVRAEIMEALLGDPMGKVTTSDRPTLQEIVQEGDGDLNPAMVAKVFQDAGVQRVYDLRTGAPSLVSVNTLPAQLRKIDPEGRRMFSMHPPEGLTPVVGTHKCLLHPDERQPEYDAWGLPPCRKSNLTSPMQVEQHMRRRHRVEFETIQKAREKAERDEDRQLQRQIAASAVANNKK